VGVIEGVGLCVSDISYYLCSLQGREEARRRWQAKDLMLAGEEEDMVEVLEREEGTGAEALWIGWIGKKRWRKQNGGKQHGGQGWQLWMDRELFVGKEL
jgi:hypothetical protein